MEEVVPLGQSHITVHHSSTWRVRRLPIHPKEPGVDPLADNDVGELEVSLVDASSLEALLNGLDLMFQHIIDLTITHSVPIKNDALGHFAIEVVVLAQRPGNGWADVVVKLLSGVGVQVRHAQVLRERLVQTCHQSSSTSTLLSAVMVGVVAYHHSTLHGNVHRPRLPT